MNKRIEKIRKLMIINDLDAFIVSNASNRRYLSGFTGSTATLVILEDKAYFVTDFRYIEQAKIQCKDFEVVDVAHHETYGNFYKKTFEANGVKKVGAEGSYLTYEAYLALQKSLEGMQVVSVNIDNLRLIKDRQEADIIIKANQIAEKAFNYVLQHALKAGASEVSIANLLESKMKEFGASEIGRAHV